MLSVIITAYKAKYFVKECVEAILNQYADTTIEILIGVDKCDETLIECKKFKQIGIYEPSENIGTYILRNSLAKKAKFDKFIFFDVDDIMAYNYIDTVLNNFADFDIVRTRFINFKGGEIERLLHQADGVFACTKEFFFRNDGFRGFRMSADTDFIRRGNPKVNNLKDYLFWRRLHTTNLTSEFPIRHEKRMKVWNEILKLRDKKIPIVTTTLKTIQRPKQIKLTKDVGTIGVGVTVHNRNNLASQSIQQIKKHLPEGAKLVIIDDASKVPIKDSDYRFESNVGIAKAKNKCLELLSDCDHIFLFDDDTYPISKDWFIPYCKSNENHFCFTLRNEYNIINGVRALSLPFGCMMYVNKEALNVVGGFDTGYIRYGFEHNDFSCRIFNNGLTSFLYQDVLGSENLIKCNTDAQSTRGAKGEHYQKNRERFFSRLSEK